MSNALSRRGFVKGAGLAGAALAAAGIPAAAMADIAWDYRADVVVLGYGAAGAACAIEAADNGASVIIVEKESLPGGSMARCGGAIMGAGTRVQSALGYEDGADALFDWVMACTDGMCPEGIARAYAEHAGANVDWLEDLNAEYVGTELFEYARAAGGTGDQRGSSGGSGCLDATGCEYEKFGVSKETAMPRTHWATAAPDNTCNSGPELFQPLYAKINATESIVPMFETKFREFVFNAAGEIVGVVAETAEGDVRIGANKGVMLATGGFCAGDEMREVFVPDSVGRKCYMSDACVGEGIKAAMAIGAGLAQMSYYYPIDVKQAYHYNTQYNDVFYHWDMDDDGWMEVPEMNMAECHGGVVIDAEARVHDVWGNSIPRLYCSGNDAGTNIFGKPGNYPGCGCYVSFAVCFGRIAGANIAALDPIA